MSQDLSRDPRVDVHGDTIIVSFPNSPFRAEYRKPEGEPHLIGGATALEPKTISLALRSVFLARALPGCVRRSAPGRVDRVTMTAFEITPDLDEGRARCAGVVNDALERLTARRVDRIGAIGPLAKSMLAWKVAAYQEAMLYRVVMLASGCAANWNAGNVLCSVLAGRALVETVALLLDFERRLESSLAEQNLSDIGALITNLSFATRDEEWLEKHPDSKAVSVLTVIERLDKRQGFERTLKHYKALSELCHPNHGGHLGLFGTLNQTTRETTFTDKKRLAQRLNFILAAALMVGIAEHAFDRLEEAVLRLAALQDRIDPIGG